MADRAPARAQEAVDLFTQIPPRWEDRTEDDWLSFAGAVKRKVYDGRFAMPEKQWPYFLGWNGQMTNAPGTTCFLPVVDNTRQYINVMLILLSEPHGKVPLFIDDWQPFRPSNAMEWAAWAAAKVGLVDPIPYQPIGGLKRARGGFASVDTPAPMGSITTVRTDYEAHFLFQNLMLTGEALRLGGWVHGAPMIPHVWERDPAKGILGLGLPPVQREDVRLALEALAAGAGVAAQLRRDRRRARGPVPAVRQRHGRGGRPGARGEVRARRHVRERARSSPRPTRTRRPPRPT